MEDDRVNILAYVSETSQPVSQISLGEEFALPQLQTSQNIISDLNIKIEPTRDTIKSDSDSQTVDDGILKIESRRVRCPECDRYSCETEEKLLLHIRKVHRKENPFQCYMCDYSTYNKTVFEEHCRIHQGIKPFKCSKCPYRSASKKNTKKHELLHRPDNPRKCNLCEFVARNNNSLLKHKLEIHGIDLKCSHCKYTASTEAELSDHLSTHDGVHTCERCGLNYETKVQLRKHISNGRRCNICNTILCSRKLLRAHRVAVHNLEIETEVTVKEAVFHCSLCEWTSSVQTKILLHLIHHPNQYVDEAVVDISILRKHGIME